MFRHLPDKNDVDKDIISGRGLTYPLDVVQNTSDNQEEVFSSTKVS